MNQEKKAFEFDETLAQQLNLLFRTEALKKARKKYFELLNAKAAELVLDVGCGTAANAIALVEEMSGNCRVIGVDNSQPMLAIAEKNLRDFRYAGQINVQLIDAHHLPFPENHFDSAMIIQVLEYSKEPVRMLKETKHVLKPGGKLLLVDTDWDSLVWNSPEKEKTRKIVVDWSDHEADGWQGRKLFEYLKRAGFGKCKHEPYVISETTFRESDYSYLMTRIVSDYLIRAEKMDRESLEEWITKMKEKDHQGHFYFSLNRYIFVATKD